MVASSVVYRQKADLSKQIHSQVLFLKIGKYSLLGKNSLLTNEHLRNLRSRRNLDVSIIYAVVHDPLITVHLGTLRHMNAD